MIKVFLLQLQFLTRIPVFIKIDFDENRFAKGIIFAPVIGLIIGGVLSLIYYLANFLDNRLIIAIFIVFAEIIVTGGLHLDGLADSCDGLFSGRNKEKTLEIMKDSRIGTNGAIGIILLIIFKISILFSLGKDDFIKYLLIFPVMGRLNVVWSAGISKYARNSEGMGKSITNITGVKQIIISSIITLIIGVLILKIYFLIVFVMSILFVLTFTFYVKRKIDGITGDIMGATIEMTEVLILFIFFVIEKFLK
jgi:adenosylcobinamide-GDP ribazoletransferase